MNVNFSQNEIMETINMVQAENLDVRTITMGISLRDCCHSDPKVAAQKVYDKICRRAQNLVSTGKPLAGISAFPSSTNAFPSLPWPW